MKRPPSIADVSGTLSLWAKRGGEVAAGTFRAPEVTVAPPGAALPLPGFKLGPAREPRPAPRRAPLPVRKPEPPPRGVYRLEVDRVEPLAGPIKIRQGCIAVDVPKAQAAMRSDTEWTLGLVNAACAESNGALVHRYLDDVNEYVAELALLGVHARIVFEG